MEKETLAVQVTEELFQRVKWAVTKEGIKQKDFILHHRKSGGRGRSKWKELEQPEENAETDRLKKQKKLRKMSMKKRLPKRKLKQWKPQRKRRMQKFLRMQRKKRFRNPGKKPKRST